MRPAYRLRRLVAIIATVAFTFTAASAPVPATAAMISTDQVIAESNAAEARDRVSAFLNRDDVVRQMSQLGVDVTETQERVAALSDAEVARIAGQLDTVPAGEGIGALIAIAGIVFVILLITDFVGATDVFTFVK